MDGLETTTVIGGGAIDYTLGLSVSGAPSGLIDTATGDHVFLFLEGGQVIGRAGDDAAAAASGPAVFTLSVDDSGVVTLDQLRAVVHDDPLDPDEATSPATLLANLVTLTATITDGDGDTNSATLNIGASLKFEDDGPTLTTATVTFVDEDDLTSAPASYAGNSDVVGGDDLADPSLTNVTGSFGVAFGADGPGSVSNVTVSAASATDAGTPISLTSQGEAVLLVQDGTNPALWHGVAGGDRDVFTVEFNVNTGAYSFTLLDNLDHPIGDNPATPANESTEDNLLLTFGFKATDGDADSVTGSFTVNVDDDSPVVTPIAEAPLPALTVDETNLALDATANFGALFTAHFGADGPGGGTIIEASKIDLYLLQDLSGSFSDDVPNVSAAITELITRIGGSLPSDTHLGAGSFVDKPYRRSAAPVLATMYSSMHKA